MAKTMAKILRYACIIVVCLAACGGTQAAASNANLCCYLQVLPQFGPKTACSVSPGACAPPDGNTASVSIPSADGNGMGSIYLNGGGIQDPFTGLCFGSVPDYCLTVDTSPDFVQDTTRLPEVQLSTSSNGPWYTGQDYIFCVDKAGLSCPASDNEFQSVPGQPNICCTQPRAMSVTTYNAVYITDSTPLQTNTHPMWFFASHPVPAVPRGMAIGFGAALAGLGVTLLKRK